MDLKKELKKYSQLEDGSTISVLAKEIYKQSMSGVFLKMGPLSKLTNVSESSITKFSQKLGYVGFKDLMDNVKKINKDYRRPEKEENENNNDINVLKESILTSINNFHATNKVAIDDVLDLIKNFKNDVYIIGNDHNNECLSFIYDLLSSSELRVFKNHTNYHSLNLYNKMTKDDLIIFVSIGDQNEYANFMYENVRKKAGKAIVVSDSTFDEYQADEDTIVVYLDQDQDTASVYKNKILMNYIVYLVYKNL
ncbi:hypothetical protein [[Acholeplasma] multilocale]|uniref:hypothetical protein n=1 Tax=[Acholeplasma] multilocale TaxID=264638 RepID=UPI0003F8B16E|nr:hypothetical protein [[Acholeplasma] multilocale]